MCVPDILNVACGVPARKLISRSRDQQWSVARSIAFGGLWCFKARCVKLVPGDTIAEAAKPAPQTALKAADGFGMFAAKKKGRTKYVKTEPWIQ